MSTLLKKSSPCQTTRSISEKIYQSCQSVIPGGVNSPVRSFKSLGMNPLVVSKGAGAEIFDADGNSYIDYCGSWGALIHGHAHPLIVEAAVKQVQEGSSFGILTAIEEKIAKKLTTLVPSVEKCRFVSSGTEATMSAIRLARGYTGRDVIVKFTGNYHGHADHLLVQAGSGVTHLNATSSSLGVPDDFVKHTVSLPFNDIDACLRALRELKNKVAAIICEPIPANMGVILPKNGFLQMLREESQAHGSLLIFDEVISGFRVALAGAQGLYKIKPDLSCFGKIIGGGFPAAAFGGKKQIMDLLAPLGGVYQAGTLSGNPVACQAGFMALQLLEKPHFYETLQEKTDLLLKPINDLIVRKNLNATLTQVGSMFTLFLGARKCENFEDVKKLDPNLFKAFFSYLFERGIYFSPLQCEANFVSHAHSEKQLIYTRDVILEFLENSHL